MALKDEYFTISEASKEVGVTRQTISRWVKDGMLSAEKVGRAVLIKKNELYEYNEKRLLEEKRSSVEGQLISVIRETYGYADDIEIEFTDLGFVGPDRDDLRLSIEDVKIAWLFLINLKDGKQEKVWVRLGKPEILVRDKGDLFVFFGTKLPIEKMGREIHEGKQ
jgi:excisionase family DNA binding protein